MASKKTLEERISLIAEKERKAREKASQIVEQRKLLERKQQDIDRRQRTKRLIEIGAAAESVLGRPFEEGEVELFMNFLRQQEKNGSYFSRLQANTPPGQSPLPFSLPAPFFDRLIFPAFVEKGIDSSCVTVSSFFYRARRIRTFK